MIRRRRLWLAPLCVALAYAVLAQQAPPIQQAMPPPATDEPTDLPLQDPPEERDRLSERAEDSSEQTEQHEETAHRAVEKIVGVSQVVLGTVAVAVGIATVVITVCVGLASVFVIFIAARVDRQQRRARRTYVELTSLKQNIEDSWGQLDRDFDSLPEEEFDTVAGGDGGEDDGDPLANPSQALLSDYDTLLLVADRLRISVQQPETMAERFVRMTRFWRGRRDFRRSLLRVDRALELDPRSHAALMQKAFTLSAAVADSRQRAKKADTDPLPPLTASQRLRLDEALTLLVQSDRHRGEPSAKSVQQRAFIYDELGDYARAIATYRQARDLLAERRPLPNDRLRELITYNLVCSLCMAEQLNEALEELATLVGKGPHLEDAAEDPQLAALRRQRKTRFDELLARDRELRGV